MNTAEATLTLVIFSSIFYGCYKLIESQESKYQQQQDEYKALYERLVVAVEKLTEQGKAKNA